MEVMKNKVFVIAVAMVFGAAALLLATGTMAGTKAPDMVKMEAGYPHTKGIVQFSHKKHATDYKAGCGECHHDDKGQPLAALKDGDAVKKCFECHNKPGELKGKDATGKSKKEKLEYHANALHDNCIGCHKTWNEKNNSKNAPTTCTKCHPGKE